MLGGDTPERKLASDNYDDVTVGQDHHERSEQSLRNQEFLSVGCFGQCFYVLGPLERNAALN